MTHIRVNPQSMTQYGNDATQIFSSMHNELTNLVDMVVTVQFFGPNAVDFKTRCGTLASDFARNLHRDISQMAEAVRVSVSNIQGSLGGATVNIAVEGKEITAPAVASVDYVDVDTTALEGLKPDVTAKFTALNGLLDDHLNRLIQTDWAGNAKEQAVATVSSFTTAAKNRCVEAQESINKFVDEQLTAVTTADV